MAFQMWDVGRKVSEWITDLRNWYAEITVVSSYDGFGGGNEGIATVTGSEQGNDNLGGRNKVIILPNINNFNLALMALRTLSKDLTNKYLTFGTIQVIDTWEGKSFDVFDTVSVLDPMLDIAGDFRILKISKRWNASSGETTEIELTNMDHMGIASFVRTGDMSSVYEEIRRLLVDFASHSIFGDDLPG